MATQWPTEEPTFKKLTDEEIKMLEGEKLENQLRIDKRNRFNYKMKVGTYLGGGLPVSWLFLYEFDLFFTILNKFWILVVILFDLVCAYFAIRAYRKLVQEVRPQYAKLLQRYTEFRTK